MNPTVKLPDHDPQNPDATHTPAATATQRWLWECYTEDIRHVRELAGDDEIIVVHVGDITWGTTHPDLLVSGVLSDQPMIATTNLLPLAVLDNVHTIRLIHGTCAHEFGHGSASEIVAQYLKRQFPGKSVSAVRHNLLDVDGVEIDCAHHGPPPGSRSWLKGNMLRYAIRDQMIQDVLDGGQPPRVVVRGHYHECVKETVTLHGLQDWETTGIILPSYAGLTHYAQKVTRSAYKIGCGMAALEIIDGHLASEGVHLYRRTVDLRTREVL
jgi:hypothetical protein